MLVHSALMFTNTTCDFNNALVNAEINLNFNRINRLIEILWKYWSFLFHVN